MERLEWIDGVQYDSESFIDVTIHYILPQSSYDNKHFESRIWSWNEMYLPFKNTWMADWGTYVNLAGQEDAVVGTDEFYVGEGEPNFVAGLLTYALVPIMSATMGYLDIFRYEPSSTKYADWDSAFATAPANVWQYANDLDRYTGFAFWTMASLTTILSIPISSLADINEMVWNQGYEALRLVSFVSGLLYLYAYNVVYTAYSQDNSGNDATIASYIAAATTIKSEMELDMATSLASKGLVGITLMT